MTEPLSKTIAYAGMGEKVPTKDWKIIEVWDWQVREWAEAAAALEAEVYLLREFVAAHDAVEAGVVSFDLQHAAVERLTRARAALAKEQSK